MRHPSDQFNLRQLQGKRRRPLLPLGSVFPDIGIIDKKGNIIFMIKGNKISYKSYKTTDSQLSTVYIAKSKGSKYHRNSHCSNMKTPQAISLQEAKKQGYQPCQKCCQ